jgi:hypothetical protein
MKTQILLFALFLGFSLTSCDKFLDCVPQPPKGDCICTDHIEFVCGCDGITYTTPCDAECHNILDYTPGPCKSN